MSSIESLIAKLELIVTFEKLALRQINKSKTLQEACLEEEGILFDQLAKHTQGTQTDFGPLVIENCPKALNHYYSNRVKKQAFPQLTNFQAQEGFEKILSSEKPTASPEATIGKTVKPIVEIDVLILINNPNTVNYVEKSFQQPGIRFFYHIDKLRFENPTVIVRISASRNLDDKLESAIQNMKPKKSVTMILLSQGSVPISDRQVTVPNTKTKISMFPFLYDDQHNEPPFRKENVCETKGLFKISDVFDLIRSNL